MRIGSLCSGYGGLDDGLALAEPDAAVVFCAETDPDASVILGKRHPGVPNLGDIRTANWTAAPQIDLLTAGFPCQAISKAGQRRAEADDRWLWPAVLDAIRALQPDRLFFENVQNLASIRSGELLQGILADLQAAGYSARWLILGACAIGAPHHRHRWFLAGERSSSPQDPVRVDTQPCGARRNQRRVLFPTLMARRSGNNRGGGSGRAGPIRHSLDQIGELLPTPTAYEAARGGPQHPDKRRAGGHAFTLQDVACFLPGVQEAAALLPTPRASDGERGRATPGQVYGGGSPTLGAACQPEWWGQYAEAVALWEKVTACPAPAPTEPNRNGKPRLAARLPEWMMGLSPGTLTDQVDRPAALRLAGNGVVPLQAALAWSLLSM